MGVRQVVNALEKEFKQQKAFFSELQKKAQILFVSFHQLPLKDRVKLLQDVQRSVLRMEQFFLRTKSNNVSNTGLRFGLDTLQQSFQIFLARWRKFERSLDQDPP